MRLYFLRHAEAGYDAPTDEARQLTPKGIERTKTAAQVMKSLNIAPQLVYSSPRVRARQTAEIVADVLGLDVDVRPEVDFNFSLTGVRILLQALDADADEVMFVGHNPSMSEVVSALTGAEVSLKKGGLARVDLYGGPSLSGQLVWLVAPKIFDVLIEK